LTLVFSQHILLNEERWAEGRVLLSNELKASSPSNGKKKRKTEKVRY
jgi:hypothetical protein